MAPSAPRLPGRGQRHAEQAEAGALSWRTSGRSRRVDRVRAAQRPGHLVLLVLGPGRPLTRTFLAAFSAGITAATFGSWQLEAFEHFGEKIAELFELAALWPPGRTRT